MPAAPTALDTVTYGAVGATQAPDLVAFPPAGFVGREARSRIGHGPRRWAFAVEQVMSWGVKRRSGFRVVTVASEAGPRRERVYSSDGVELVHPGDTVVLHFGRIEEPVRVVYTIDEPRRRGFGYGTLPGHPLQGEECFEVEYRDDGSVWLTVRSFSRPSTGTWEAARPLLRIAQWVVTRRYLRSLAQPIG